MTEKVQKCHVCDGMETCLEYFECEECRQTMCEFCRSVKYPTCCVDCADQLDLDIWGEPVK